MTVFEPLQAAPTNSTGLVKDGSCGAGTEAALMMVSNFNIIIISVCKCSLSVCGMN